MLRICANSFIKIIKKWTFIPHQPLTAHPFEMFQTLPHIQPQLPAKQIHASSKTEDVLNKHSSNTTASKHKSWEIIANL